MSRRQLRIVSSSSDEDDGVSLQPPPLPTEEEVQDMEEDDQTISTLNLHRVNLNSSNSISNSTPRNPNILQPVPFNISDDDDDSVAAAAATTTNICGTANRSPNNSNRTNYPVSDSPISNILQSMGLRLRREWMESCIEGLQRSVVGFSGFDDSTKAKLCLQQFLQADMNFCGAGSLPENVHSLHLVDLKGPFVLQVDEIVNISRPLRSRYEKAGAGIKRCLKLSMTDGVQRVFGMEYKEIEDLDALSPAGLKVVISNVNVRRGLLMLVPQVIGVLGGKVEILVAAQQRLIHEVNKPPRGKRTRTVVVTPLARRGTVAAWPPESVQEQENGSSRTGRAPAQMDQQGTSSNTPASGENRQSHDPPIRSEDAVPAEINDVHIGTGPEQHVNEMNRGESAVTSGREEAEPNFFHDEFFYNEDIQMVDELEHTFSFPTVEKESPFTYLSDLAAKQAAVKDGDAKIKGKVKCFLTGVKGFQYKHRTTYELRVYIDDGSLIMEILIDHNVVQKCIGYSPIEVSAALASSDTRQISNMKETLKQFQIFLVNFEEIRRFAFLVSTLGVIVLVISIISQGTMLLEYNETSSVPVATEMNQGCFASDAWLLLQRLKSSASAQQRHCPQLNTINLSP